MRRAVILMIGVLAMSCTPEPRVFTDDLVEVPSVVGSPVSEAREDLTDMGFGVRTVPEGSDSPADCSEGTVVEQDPPDTEEVLKASTITLTVQGCR